MMDRAVIKIVGRMLKRGNSDETIADLTGIDLADVLRIEEAPATTSQT